MPTDLFVSYSRKDQEQVLTLVRQLEEAGISLWRDETGIDGAAHWPQVIVEAIRSSRVLLLMLSPTSAESEQVVREVTLAMEAKKPILPLRLAPVEVPPALEYPLAGIQMIDLFSASPGQQLQPILRALARLGTVGEATGNQSEPTLPSPPIPSIRVVGEQLPNNLPQPLTRFIGREGEIAEPKERLTAGMARAATDKERAVRVTPPSRADQIESWEVLQLLTGLVEKSLVVYEEDEQGIGRYRLLETVRQYMRDRLLEEGEADAVQERHGDWFLALAEEAEAALGGPAATEWLQRLEREHDNLRAALEGLGSQGQSDAGLRLGGALSGFWHMRGYWTEGREHLTGILALPGAEARTAARAEALLGAGKLAEGQGDCGAAQALFAESLMICQALDSKRGIAEALGGLGDVACDQQEYVAARGLYEEGLAVFRELADKQGTAWALLRLGLATRHEGDRGAARGLYEEGLAIFRELGNKEGIAWLLVLLGDVARDQEEYGAARALLRESLAMFRELGHQWGVAASLGLAGSVACDLGEYGAARVFLEESLGIYRELGVSLTIYRELGFKGSVADTISRLGRLVHD